MTIAINLCNYEGEIIVDLFMFSNENGNRVVMDTTDRGKRGKGEN